MATRDVAAWTGPLYQNANRLAYVHWLRSRGVRAWLVHLLFTDDPHRPTSRIEWEKAIDEADSRLGLSVVALDAAGHVFFPGGSREELLS